VVAFHGTADPDIAYTGGLGPAALQLPAFDGSGRTIGEEGLQRHPPLNGAAIPAISTAWAERNGCGPRPVARPVAADVTRLAWTCPAGTEVELYRISGGGHTWPGSAFTAAAASILGRTTMSISADAVIWRFFQAHPLRDP
jgi:polyhydroxybutyrate depolymerase